MATIRQPGVPRSRQHRTGDSLMGGKPNDSDPMGSREDIRASVPMAGAGPDEARDTETPRDRPMPMPTPGGGGVNVSPTGGAQSPSPSPMTGSTFPPLPKPPSMALLGGDAGRAPLFGGAEGLMGGGMGLPGVLGGPSEEQDPSDLLMTLVKLAQGR